MLGFGKEICHTGEDCMSSVQHGDRSDRKKQHQAPYLRIYGSLGTLTASLSNTAANSDGGSVGSMTKTH
jgi:hypothetical protein